jgi:hypothetical protein
VSCVLNVRSIRHVLQIFFYSSDFSTDIWFNYTRFDSIESFCHQGKSWSENDGARYLDSRFSNWFFAFLVALNFADFWCGVRWLWRGWQLANEYQFGWVVFLYWIYILVGRQILSLFLECFLKLATNFVLVFGMFFEIGQLILSLFSECFFEIGPLILSLFLECFFDYPRNFVHVFGMFSEIGQLFVLIFGMFFRLSKKFCPCFECFMKLAS